MKEDNINELSWLNENNSKNEYDTSSSTSRLLPVKAEAVSYSAAKSNANIPSWALEENSADDEDNRSNGSKEIKRNSIHPINVKWKNKKRRAVEIHTDSTVKDDEDDWRCCPSDPILACFQCFHFTSGLNGFLALMSNAYVYVLKDLPVYDLVVHGYALVFCLMIVFVELDWRLIVSRVKFLDIWVLRGLFYIFVGLITANNLRSRTIESEPFASQRVMGIILCFYGGFYILMALFCLKAVKEHHMRSQLEQYVEIDDR